MILSTIKYAIVIIMALQVSLVSIFSIHISYLNSQKVETKFIAEFDSNADENTSGKMFELEEEEESILSHRFWHLESLTDHTIILTTAFDTHNFYLESHYKEVQSPPPRQLS